MTLYICGQEITAEPLLGRWGEGCSPSCGEQVGLAILSFLWLVSGAPVNRPGTGWGDGVICSLSIFLEGLLCARHCSRSWGYSTEPDRQFLSPQPHGTYVLVLIFGVSLFFKLETLFYFGIELQKSCKDGTDTSNPMFPRLYFGFHLFSTSVLFLVF